MEHAALSPSAISSLPTRERGLKRFLRRRRRRPGSSLPTRERVNNFYGSWTAATANQPFQAEVVNLQETRMQLSFKQWSPSFPHIQSPFALQSSMAQDLGSQEYVMFTFSLSGLEEVARWYQGRYKTSVSVAGNLDMLVQAVSNPIDALELQESVREIHFRPKLVNGEAQTVTATLLYQLAESR